MRTSQYLLNRCNTLDKALQFFFGTKGDRTFSGKEKRIVFLLQIKYWDFEIDSLIFSFDTFKTRQSNWKESLELSLNTLPYILQKDVIKSAKNADYYRESTWYFNKREDVVAPIQQLNILIEKWNNLIELCEKTLLDTKSKEKSEKYGFADIEYDLKKYKKEKIND